MHAEALDFIARQAAGSQWALTVLDVGGRNVNGSPRHLWPTADYTVLDQVADAGVDIVADAASWRPNRLYDVVVCAEVLEHTPAWPEVVATCVSALRSGGTLVITCAGPGRAPHSAVDGESVRPGEHYANVDPLDLHVALRDGGATTIHVESNNGRGDVYATASR
jgi:SAM-dependent methyltransferase